MPATLEIRRSESRRRKPDFNIGHGVKTLTIERHIDTDDPIVTPEIMRTTPRLEPIVAMMIGRRGKGKTAAMTWLSGFQRNVYRRLGLPNKIGANYWNAYADVLNPQLVTWLNSEGLHNPLARNMYACVDEVGGQFANRRSLSQSNVDFIQVLTQIRKLDTEMVFTTQFPQWIDIAVLYQIDLFIRVEGVNQNRQIEMHIFDWWGQWTGKDYRKPWPPQINDADWMYKILDADITWGNYNTKQIVPPIWAKNMNQVILNEWGENFIQDDSPLPDGAELMADAKVVAEMGPPNSVGELCERYDKEGAGFKLMEPFHIARSSLSMKSKLAWKAAIEKEGYEVDDNDHASK